MNNYDPILFTQRYVFGRDTASGTLSTNDDYNEHIRPLGSPQPPAVEYDMLDYLENGAGRYAVPAVFPIVDDFFTTILDVDTYDISEIRQELDLLDDDDFKKATKTSIWQYGTDTTSFDFAERAYIFGSTNFKLDLTNAEFEVTDKGNKFITGMQVIAKDDNFDFQGGAGPINAVANAILLPAYDPYGLGDDPLKLGNREVPIKYTTSTSGRTYGTSSDPYSESDWVVDDIYETTNISIAGTASGAAKLAAGIGQFFSGITSPALAGSYLFNINSDPFLRYLRDDFKVIYGTSGNDNLSNLNRESDLFDPFPLNTPVLMVGGTGNDNMTGTIHSDELLGGDNNDTLDGGSGNDTLNGGANNDTLDGGSGEDIAIYSDPYTDASGNPNYDISTNTNTKVTTITHINGGIDGTDTLKNVEFAQFNGGTGQQTTLSATSLANSNNGAVTNSNTASEPARIIPLPLEDGVEDTEIVRATDLTPNPNSDDLPTPPYVSLTTPVDMLDGDIEYTLNISPYEPDTNYNIAYIIDTSATMNGEKLQQTKDAYTDLTNYFIDNELADNINFGVVSFGRETATLESNLSAEEAITSVQNLTSVFEGTQYDQGLLNASLFLLNSRLDRDSVTNIAYFATDSKSTDSGALSSTYRTFAKSLRKFAVVQAFGIDDDPFHPSTVVPDQINFVDSNDGVLVDSAADLSTELLKSDLADDLVEVNILLDGEVIDTLTPDQFTDSPLGLTYTGTAENETEIEGLDVSVDAENIITAEVIFTDESNLDNTSIEQTVTAGKGELLDENGNPIDESGNEDVDPFERERNGSDGDDDITLGFVDKGANGGAGGDYIVGNRRDNILDGGEGNDTIFGHEGNDTITGGTGDDKIDGGEGIDTALYNDLTYQGNSNISFQQVGDTVTYNDFDSSDYLTNVEYLQFSDVRIDAFTQEITPTIAQIGDIGLTEGETVSFSFDLDYPATTDIVFDYATQDRSAVAGSDYNATSGQVTIPAGNTNATIDISTIEDTIYDEGTETFSLNLTGLTGATFSNNETELSLTAYIEDRDEPLDITGGNEDDVLTGGDENDSLKGGAGNDYLYGNAGNDIIRGENGDDYLDGGDGDDSLFGNAGNDTVIGGNGTDRIVEISNGNFVLSDTNLDANGIDTISEIEIANLTGGNANNSINASAVTAIDTIIKSQAGNDTIRGGAVKDTIDAGTGNDIVIAYAGNDNIKGGAGNDSLNGGEGDDTIVASAGDDTIIGGSGIDLLIESGDNNFILTNSSLVGNGTDSLRAIQQVNLTGGNSSNNIDASATTTINKTILTGGAGDDTISGGAKQDVLYGDDGNDSLTGGDLRDVLYGGTGNDVLMGMSGNDVIRGEAGDDTIIGGEGTDVFTGGAGADIFAVEVTTTGRDVILDFEDGVDRILLGSGLSFDDLRIVGNAEGTVSAIRLESNEQLLTVVKNISYTDLTIADFDLT